MENNSDLLKNEPKAKLPVFIKEFKMNHDLNDVNSTLDNLFFEWIGSDQCNDSDQVSRASIANHYRELKKLISYIEEL